MTCVCVVWLGISLETRHDLFFPFYISGRQLIGIKDFYLCRLSCSKIRSSRWYLKESIRFLYSIPFSYDTKAFISRMCSSFWSTSFKDKKLKWFEDSPWKLNIITLFRNNYTSTDVCNETFQRVKCSYTKHFVSSVIDVIGESPRPLFVIIL